MVPTIKVDEWMDALDQLSKRNDKGSTVSELAERLGRSPETVRKLLHKARVLGWLVIGERTGTNLRGRPCNFTVYSIVKTKR
jgi:DNA-binding IclR family transcriptional regulator